MIFQGNNLYRVSVRSVLDHLDALALLALFRAVLRDHVQLTDLVLESVLTMMFITSYLPRQR